MALTEVCGKKIYTETYGENNKKVLLYLHGGPGASCLDFHNQAVAIGERHKVIAIDQYGVLRSDAIPADEAYGMRTQIDMLEQMRRDLNIERWSLLGHSYGGMLACLYANLFPDSISTVIYECPGFNFKQSFKTVTKYFLAFFQQENHEKGIKLCNENLAKEFQDGDRAIMNTWAEMSQIVHDQKVRNYLHSVSFAEYEKNRPTAGIPKEWWQKANTHFEKLIQDGEMFSNFLGLLDQNRQPSLLITGDYDPACGEDQIDYFINHAPKAHHKAFHNSGHFPRIEQAQEYTECVCDFIDEFAV